MTIFFFFNFGGKTEKFIQRFMVKIVILESPSYTVTLLLYSNTTFNGYLMRKKNRSQAKTSSYISSVQPLLRPSRLFF